MCQKGILNFEHAHMCLCGGVGGCMDACMYVFIYLSIYLYVVATVELVKVEY